MPSSSSSSWRQHGLVLLIYLVAYFVLTYPAVHDFSSRLYGEGGDLLQNLWNNWWVRHAVAHGQSPWHTDHLFHPEGVTLLGATLNPFNGFLTIPLCWFFDQVVAYNLTVVFAFVIAGQMTFVLARDLGCRFWPSVIGGAVFTFSPYHFGNAAGHMQLISLQWLPFFFYAWVRLLRQPTHRRGMVAGLALFLNLLCDYYYTLFCILGGIVLVCCKAWHSRQPLFFVRREVLRPWITFVLSCLVLCGPILGPFLLTHVQDPFLGAHQEHLWVNDLLAPFIYSQAWRFYDLSEWYWRHHPLHENYHAFGSHLGIAVLVVSGYAWWISRKVGQRSDTAVWVTLGGLFYLFSLGPNLLVLGERYPSVPMPLNGLKTILPIMKIGGAPMRMAVIYYLAAAILVAFGLGYAADRCRYRKVGLLVFLGLLCFEYWPRIHRRYRIELPGVVEALAELPPGAVVGFVGVGVDPLLYQTYFEKPVPSGYIARTPTSRAAHIEEYRKMRAAGDYTGLMKRFDATYLVRHIATMNAPDPAVFARITGDGTFELFARRDDPRLPEYSTGPSISVRPGTPGDGGRKVFDVVSRADAGYRFCVAFGPARGSGVTIGGARIELEDSRLLRATLNPDSPLFDNWGTLDARGRATVSIDLPGSPPTRDEEVWCSLIVWQRDRPDRIRRITPPKKLTLRW